QFRKTGSSGRDTAQNGLLSGISILEKHASRPEKQSTYPEHQVNLHVDPGKEGILRRRPELLILNVSWLHNLLYAPIREQIHRCQKEIGFKYIRCHGVFDNPMHIFNRDSSGRVYYNFSFLDMAYDFVKEEGLIPYVELSYIPPHMSQHPTQDFWCRVNMSMPDHLGLWKDLIIEFLNHCINRYGIEYVLQWKFTIIQAIHVYMLNFTLDEYFSLYKATYEAVKSVDSRLQIGGPGSQLSYDCFSDFRMLKGLFSLYKEKQCVPDFLAFEIFHNIYTHDGKHIFDLAATHTSEPLVISDDPEWILTLKAMLHTFLAGYGFQHLPIIIDCWNSTMWQRDPSNDTCYKSAFIMKNMLEYGSLFDGFGFWHMSDLNDELSGTCELYHGGYGLFTQNGIPKSGFNAYVFLRMLGDWELIKGDGCYVSRNSDQDIRIALYNYSHFDFLSRQNIYPESGRSNRYAIFRNEVIMDYHLTLDLDPGTYKLESYIISGWQKKGSSYDTWAASGAPDKVDKEIISYLTDLGRPGYSCSMLTAGEEPVTISRKLYPLESMLIIIRRAN
ncbi:MAG: GH39 family glycosyl hydrolase, partial [Lachnospiraceae bacterium]